MIISARIISNAARSNSQGEVRRLAQADEFMTHAYRKAAKEDRRYTKALISESFQRVSIVLGCLFTLSQRKGPYDR